MSWENIIFSGIAGTTLAITVGRFGWNSFLGLGVGGAFLYAIPAMIGIYAPLHVSVGLQSGFTSPSVTAVLSLGLAWLVLLFFSVNLPVPQFRFQKTEFRVKNYLLSCAILSFLGYLSIAANLGPFFFLNERSETNLFLVSTLWRWTFVFGFVIAFYAGRRAYLLYFLAFLCIYMLAGDRTIPAITAGACMLSALLSSKRRAFRPEARTVLIVLSVFALLLVAKPIYLFLKDPSMGAADILLSQESFARALTSFEPLTTFGLLQMSIDQGLNMKIDSFLLSIMGNALVFPSAFGVDTNYFNEFITAKMPIALSFGIAGNYFAHAYVALGYVGIIIFSAIFVLSLYFMERFAIRNSGLVRITLVVLSATVAIYAHRNGLDNLLSFVRQIVVVSSSIAFVAILLRGSLPRFVQPRRAKE